MPTSIKSPGAMRILPAALVAILGVAAAQPAATVVVLAARGASVIKTAMAPPGGGRS